MTRGLEQEAVYFPKSSEGRFKELKIYSINDQYAHKILWWNDVSGNPKGDAWKNCEAQHIRIPAGGWQKMLCDTVWFSFIWMFVIGDILQKTSDEANSVLPDSTGYSSQSLNLI